MSDIIGIIIAVSLSFVFIYLIWHDISDTYEDYEKLKESKSTEENKDD